MSNNHFDRFHLIPSISTIMLPSIQSATENGKNNTHTISISQAKKRLNYLLNDAILPREYHKRQLIYQEIALLLKKIETWFIFYNINNQPKTCRTILPHQTAPEMLRLSTFIKNPYKKIHNAAQNTKMIWKKSDANLFAPSVESTRGMTSGVSVLGTMDRTFALIVPKNTTISSPKNRQKNIFILYIFLSFISKTNTTEMSGKN